MVWPIATEQLILFYFVCWYKCSCLSQVLYRLKFLVEVCHSNQTVLCVSNLPRVDHAALHRTMKNGTCGSEHMAVYVIFFCVIFCFGAPG